MICRGERCLFEWLSGECAVDRRVEIVGWFFVRVVVRFQQDVILIALSEVRVLQCSGIEQVGSMFRIKWRVRLLSQAAEVVLQQQEALVLASTSIDQSVFKSKSIKTIKYLFAFKRSSCVISYLLPSASNSPFSVSYLT
jgi:hypothetical protein